VSISNSSTELRFKLTRTQLFRNISIAVVFWFVLGIPTVAIWFETIAFLQAKNPDPFIFVLARVMVVIAVLLSFTFLFVNLTVALDFFSYIRVTPDGIEQRRSPFRHVKCAWSELEKFGKLQLIQDIILVKSPLQKRKTANVSTPVDLLMPKQPFILLNGYEGWSEGNLKDALKKYAPQLFEKSSDKHSG
jgi:hypothetical protein